MRRCLLVSLLWATCSLAHSAEPEGGASEYPSAKSPSEALRTFHLASGMQIELVAAEPLIADPVAFDWGADGTLWVAEMGDYPNGATWHKQGDPLGVPGGRVRLLRDDDGDGRYDQAKTFLERLSFPTGVKAWRQGVIVSTAPAVFYAEDTDGDGIADKREVLFEGFGEGNQQHRVNGLRWGLDNWLYLANGDSGGRIKSLKTGETLDLRGRDLRIRPDTGEMQAVSGQTQFGRNPDDWGNWFGGNNSNPIWHYVLDDTYLKRNPHYAASSVRHPISNQPGAAPVFPTSRTVTRFNDFDKADRFTSACSPMIYRDELLAASEGAGVVGQMFVCEPVHNLVHREVVSPIGCTFASRRVKDEQASEFLSSSDNWFRPVMVRTGPDGALWIADMYRLVIEHPEWIPATWQAKLDLRGGAEMGRLFRVFPTATRPRKLQRLDQLDTDSLVGAIDSPNGWQRDMVQQLLLWRGDRSAIESLEQLVLHAERATTRLHAICALDGLDALETSVLERALVDGHPAVQRHAVRLAERRLNEAPRLVELVIGLVDAEDAQVRMQVAYALGRWKDEQAGYYLSRLATAENADQYLRAAVMSSVRAGNLSSMLTGVLPVAEHHPRLVADLLVVAAMMNERELLSESVVRLFSLRGDDYASWQLQTAIPLLRTLRRRGEIVNGLSDAAWQSIQQLSAACKGDTSDADMIESRRLPCIQILGLTASKPDDLRVLASLLNPRQPGTIQEAAVEALTSQGHARTPALLIAAWKSCTPVVRARILDALLARSAWTGELLDSLQAGTISMAEVDARLRQRLLEHSDATLRERASKLLGASTNDDRRRVLAEYAKGQEGLAGDTKRGREVFNKSCSACHHLDGLGKQVGPDLISLTDKSPAALLVAILDPNRAVEDKFRGYLALTKDGRQVSGMITEETATSLALATADGKEHILLRADLDELHGTGKSLMPEGLERDLSPQAMADVIAFVRGVSSPPKQFPGNSPRVAPVRDDGSIRLFAMHARIHGPTLVFEEKHRNLGYWSSIEDHAIWSLEVPRDGRYRMTMDYACEDSCAGNGFVAAIAGHTFSGVIEGTGSWDNYRSKAIGTVELAAGPCEFLLRSDGKIRSHLMDLSMIRLQPLD